MSEAERAARSDAAYKDMRKQLDDALKNDSRLAKIAEKIRAGAADFRDTAEYSEIVAGHLSHVLQENVGEIRSPLGKQYACEALLKDHYAAINDVLGEVQASVDEKNGIHIAPQKAAFPAERVQQVAHALEDPTVPPETILRRAGAPIENVAKSMHDDYMEENAKFRSDAGLKCWIVRTTDGKCCSWCTSIAGRYEYGKEPQSVYRRHDNCGCTVVYESGRTRQYVWSKKSWSQEEERAYLKELDAKKKAKRLSPQQGREIEQRNLSQITRFSHAQGESVQGRNLRYRGLTSGANSGIIKARGFTPLSDSRVVPVLRKESKQWIAALNSEEIRAIKKYTKNSGDPADDKFYARLNAMLRGEIPEDETLLYYSDLISGALRKNQLKHDIVCYRNMDINPYSGLPVGSVFSAKQFYSASVTKNGTLQGKIQMIIYAHKGAKGAYIESLSKYPKQREFLLDKGCIYKILSNNGSTIEVEVIV